MIFDEKSIHLLSLRGRGRVYEENMITQIQSIREEVYELVDAKEFQTKLFHKSALLAKCGTHNEHVIPFCVFTTCIMALYFTRFSVLATLSKLAKKHTLLDTVQKRSNNWDWKLVLSYFETVDIMIANSGPQLRQHTFLSTSPHLLSLLLLSQSKCIQTHQI